MMQSQGETIHFVTGKLAAPAVQEIVQSLSREVGFRYSIDVLPITVAALMTAKWLQKHIQIPAGTDRVIVPGYLADSIDELQSHYSIPIQSGPRDIRDLPMLFGRKRERPSDYGTYDIELIAEINHAPRMTRAQIIQTAQQLVQDGADRIDIGCDPGNRWLEVADVIRALTDLGIKTSIDTFDSWEAQQAVRAGSSLVLSVNRENQSAAIDWGCELVVVPDKIGTLEGMFETAQWLIQRGAKVRLDPILEPIGCGFAASLQRYAATRQQWPECEIMMGIGNITELTDCDSAAINVVLLGICQELGIRSVLTTQVISWAQSAVRECDLARRLVHYSVAKQIPPKHLEPRLVMLRDAKVPRYPTSFFEELAQSIKDNNYRIFAQDGRIHLVSAGIYLSHDDPFELMSQLMAIESVDNVDTSHAFYLGFEMAKALTANTLGKRYEQDEALDWGMLTREEDHKRLARTNRHKNPRRSKESESGNSSEGTNDE